MNVRVTCKNPEDPIKNEGARVMTNFLHYNPIGAICCRGNQSSYDLTQKLMQPYPHPNDASYKI